MNKDRFLHAVKIAVGLWLGLSAAVSHAGAIFDVTIDTSSISGGTYSVAFDLNDGDGFGNNTVTVNNFMFDGGAITGIPNLAGGASGDMSSTVTLMDTAFFNSFDQAFTAGSLLSFTIDVPSNFGGGFFPDNFSFFLLDGISGLPITTTDPFGTDSFLTVDLTDPLNIQTFSSTDSTRPIPAPVVTAVAAVPTPGVLWLLASGLAGMVASRRKVRSGECCPT